MIQIDCQWWSCWHYKPWIVCIQTLFWQLQFSSVKACCVVDEHATHMTWHRLHVTWRRLYLDVSHSSLLHGNKVKSGFMPCRHSSQGKVSPDLVLLTLQILWPLVPLFTPTPFSPSSSNCTVGVSWNLIIVTGLTSCWIVRYMTMCQAGM